MGEPLAAGAVHETLTWVLALVPVTPVGASGWTAATVGGVGVEEAEGPTALVAVTEKV